MSLCFSFVCLRVCMNPRFAGLCIQVLAMDSVVPVFVYEPGGGGVPAIVRGFRFIFMYEYAVFV